MVVYKFYQEPGHNLIEVPADRWGWVALYSDNTCLEQYGSDGWYHQFKEIQQHKLAGFMMVNLTGQIPSITIHWVPSYKLIHFYRNTRYHVGGPDEIHVRLICFGYETIAHKEIFVIMPDDSLRVLDNLEKLQVVT